jgi:hypothetical protein
MATDAIRKTGPKAENRTKDPFSAIPIEILEDLWTPAWEVARITTEVVRRAAAGVRRMSTGPTAGFPSEG